MISYSKFKKIIEDKFVKKYLSTKKHIYLKNCQTLFIDDDDSFTDKDKSNFWLNEHLTKTPHITIYINSTSLNNRDDLKIATLSHEFGHYISYMFNKRPNEDILLRYNNDQYMSFSDIKIFLVEEARAWSIGYRLLKKEKIKISYKMIFHAIKCFYSHLAKCLLII